MTASKVPDGQGAASHHANAIIKTLDKITAAGSRPQQVFDDWLELVEACQDAIPGHFRAAVEGKPYEDTPETQKLFERLRARYPRKYFDHFAQANAQLIDAASTGYMDIVGNIYMWWGSPSKGAGQFFTPWQVAYMMAQMTTNAGEVNGRLKAAIEKSPLAQAVLLAGIVIDDPAIAEAYFLARVVPAALEHYEPVKFDEPCCGSGVMMLAYAASVPWWQTQLGLIQMYGQDIDMTCVRMARINSMLYGLNGRYAPWIVATMEARLAAWGRGDQPQVVEQPAAVVPQLDEITPQLPPPTPDAGRAYEQLTLFAQEAITPAKSKSKTTKRPRFREEAPAYHFSNYGATYGTQVS